MIDDRVPGGSLLITSQMPVDRWHDCLGKPTVADAIVDRIDRGACKISLKGESMRRLRAGDPKTKQFIVSGPPGAARPGVDRRRCVRAGASYHQLANICGPRA